MKLQGAAASLIISAVTLAQTAKAPPPVLQPTHRFERIPFDPNRERLPPHFEGNDLEAIYGALEKIPPKGEYETSASYDSRLEAVRTKALDGSVLGGSPIALIIPESDVFKEEATVSWSYEADAELLRVKIESVFHK
jgi:hypothetical protein